MSLSKEQQRELIRREFSELKPSALKNEEERKIISSCSQLTLFGSIGCTLLGGIIGQYLIRFPIKPERLNEAKGITKYIFKYSGFFIGSLIISPILLAFLPLDTWCLVPVLKLRDSELADAYYYSLKVSSPGSPHLVNYPRDFDAIEKRLIAKYHFPVSQRSTSQHSEGNSNPLPTNNDQYNQKEFISRMKEVERRSFEERKKAIQEAIAKKREF